MKKILLLALAIFSFFPFINGAEYHRALGEFTKITVIDSIPVVYRNVPDSTGSVAFNCPPEIADALLISADHGELKLRIATESVGRKEIPTVYVYSRFLTEVSNQNTAVMQINKPAPGPSFKITQMGNGKVEVTGINANSVKAKISTGNGTIAIDGECETAKYELVGTGTIQADDLKAQTVECKCLGGGTIGCWPETTLRVQCLGSTKIYYKGEPSIKKRGGGKLIPIE